MRVWLEVRKSGNVNCLAKKKNVSAEILIEAWNKLFGEFIKEFGTSEEYGKYLQKQYEATNAILEDIIAPTVLSNVMMKIKEAEFAKLQIEKPEDKKGEGLAYMQVQKYMGQRLDPNLTTVYEFYSAQKLMMLEIEMSK